MMDLPEIYHFTIYATVTVADGGLTKLKYFIKKLILSPNLPASSDQVCS